MWQTDELQSAMAFYCGMATSATQAVHAATHNTCVIDTADPACRVRTQRKIGHLLASSGVGRDFRYHPRLRPGCGFTEGETVVLTEKWDGTTVQATRDYVAKRFDNFRSGDRRKHGATERERYRLERIDLEAKEHKQIALALAPHRDALRQLPEGLCVYFEACGPKINARFRHLPDSHTIRVFDFAREGHFLSWAETEALATRFALPLVHAECVPALQLAALLQRLAAPGLRYHGADAALEGWVVRGCGGSTEARSVSEGCEGAIAKLRVDDLRKLVHHT